MTFRIPVTVRGYELDALGHVNHAVYHQYGEVARTAGFTAAGCDWNGLVEQRTAPVLLSTTVHFRRELRGNETVEVSCELKFGTGKTFHIDSMITKADGTLAAELYCVAGLMDLDARKLLEDPRRVLEKSGLRPEVLAGQD
ncbi:acyl-CoA thioesterase [Actinophytocola xanthii]|uniref:Thioesterase n=1 Tax=Actinophytocola xanthii TaxID=1912961 RepID=A0A1Q8BXA2_9PSEU|nr:thioesterase family protein [Actinophytocola xanthii]OLF06740.1 thioesterase [Actinophytocola xanthii]